MASTSLIKHKNNRLCKKCCTYINRFFKNHLITFWTRINEFIEYKSLSLGEISQNVPLNMFEASYTSSKYKQSDELTATSSDDRTLLEKAKSVKIIDISVIKAEYLGSQDESDGSFKNLTNIFFTLENIYYIDLEILSKMFKALNYIFKNNELLIASNMSCSDALPRLLFYDITIHTRETHIMNKDATPIIIEIKCTLYNEQTALDVDFYSPIQRKMNSILNQSNDLMAERLTHKTVVNIYQSDIDRLKNNLDLMFTDLCGDEIIKYDIDLIRCRNGGLIDKSSSGYIIPNRIQSIVGICDAVFCIRGYYTIHLLSLISKYNKLIMTDSFKTNGNTKYSCWKMMYFGIEKNILPKDIDDNDDIIIAFSIVSSDKDDFEHVSHPSSSSSSSSSKRSRSDPKQSSKRSRS